MKVKQSLSIYLLMAKSGTLLVFPIATGRWKFPDTLWSAFPWAISVKIRQNSDQVSHVKGRMGQKWQGREEIDRNMTLCVELCCHSRNSRVFFSLIFMTFNAPRGMSPSWKNSLVLLLRKCCFTLSLIQTIHK